MHQSFVYQAVFIIFALIWTQVQFGSLQYLEESADQDKGLFRSASPTTLEPSETNTTIFFNIFINPDRVDKSYLIVEEQLRQLRESGSERVHDMIYFNMIGRTNLTERKLSCEDKSVVRCRLLRRYESAFEEVTLDALYDYCQAYPHHTVSYLHNKGSFRKERGNTKTRRLATKAVLSDACQRVREPNEDYPCNVCSINFRTKPHYHFSTNMWTATCRFINQLIPPKKYQQVRTNMFREVWDEYQKKCALYPWEVILSNFTYVYGLGRYAMERWIPSHPNMVPCDAIEHRMAKFQRGYDEWTPGLFPSRFLTRLEYANDDERFFTWLQHREYKALYGGGPNKYFFNYTSNITDLATMPCD